MAPSLFPAGRVTGLPVHKFLGCGPHLALVHIPTFLETTEMLAVGCTMTVAGEDWAVCRGWGGLERGRVDGILVTGRLGVAVLGLLAHHSQSSRVPAPCAERGSVPGTGQWRGPVRLSPWATLSRAWTQPLVSVASSSHGPLLSRPPSWWTPSGVPASCPLLGRISPVASAAPMLVDVCGPLPSVTQDQLAPTTHPCLYARLGWGPLLRKAQS